MSLVRHILYTIHVLNDYVTIIKLSIYVYLYIYNYIYIHSKIICVYNICNIYIYILIYAIYIYMCDMEYAAYRACRWDQPPEGTKQCTSQPGSSKRRLPCRHSRSHPRSPGRSLPSVSWKVNKKKMEIGQNPTMFIGFH